MEYRVLGPIEVMHEGRNLAIGGYRQRLVLALLVCHANTIQSTDWLVDAVWGDQAPRTARRTLQVYLVRLRRLLGADAIEGTPGGYALRAEPDAVDWVRFESLARQGESLLGSRPSEAAAILREALSLWRGSPYADLADTPALRLEVRRLQESRLAVVESRVEADLQSGAEQGLLPELDELVAEHPLREHLRGLQMLALYRAGRQVEALNAFDEARRSLADQAGVDPSAELRDLHERMLRQDPSLDRPKVTGPGALAGPARATSRGTLQGDRALPSGLVTFVMSDIEGSTQLFRRFPDEYPSMLQRHHEILAAAWAPHHGVLVEADGDGTLSAFRDAAEALRACAAAQQQLEREPWPSGATLRVRMGVHTGLAVPREGDYVSLAVHQTARVSAAANGGQVLVSQATTAIVVGVDDLDLRAVGRYRLRDFDEPESLAQLGVPGGREGVLPVRALPAEGHNLTRPPTLFIDREEERRWLAATLAPGCLVTVVGPGGVGKTRLAAEVGLAVAETWPDGVWRVGVDGLGDAARLLPAIADAMAVTLTTGDVDNELIQVLRERRALLLLDGCERHRAAAADLVARILERECRSGVLATSQEPLKVSGEMVQRLRPLPVTPAEGSDTSIGPAVELYVDRARAADPSFSLTEANTLAVEALVRRLDGLPLAEEIAAARAALASPAELLDSLERSSAVLRTDNPSLPARQRTIEGLLSWSEDLLDDAQRATLRRLSVLAGPFNLASARVAVADGDVAPDDVPDRVWSLVDRSLVLADQSVGETRYRMLDLVRRFAERRLVEHGELGPTVIRVGRMFDERVGPALPSDRNWVSTVAADLDNLRRVVGLLLGCDAPEAVDLAARLAMTVVRFHDGVQSYRAGINEATAWLEALPATPGRGTLLAGVAWLHLRLLEVDEAERLARQAQHVAVELGTPTWDDLGVERTLGEIANRSGRPRDALALAEEGLGRAPNPRARARMHSQAGIAWVELGELDAAAAAFDEELAACRELGDDFLTTRAEANAAEHALARGRIGEAAQHQLRCLELATTLGQPVFVAYSAITAGRLAGGDDAATAVRLLTKAEAVLTETQHRLYAEDEARVQRLIADYRDTLGADRYGRERQHGLAMGLHELAAEAQQQLEAFVSR